MHFQLIQKKPVYLHVSVHQVWCTGTNVAPAKP